MKYLSRRISHDSEGDPVMEIFKTIPNPMNRWQIAIVPLNDAWELEDDSTKFIFAWQLCEWFGLGKFTKRRCFEIVTFLEDGLDDLVMAPPITLPTVVIGEGVVTSGGRKHSFDITKIHGSAGIE